MSHRNFKATFPIILLVVFVFSRNGFAHAAEAPPFPTDPSVWINSPPLLLSQLKGKAVFLWFFEETCPRCREKWPSLLEKANEHKGQPIIFVGVNSGNAPADVREYVREVSCPWPILADVDRSFEKACDIGEISLNNISQACFIASDGTLHPGDWSKLDETIREALQGAAWKLEPAEVPDSLKEAWLSIEFGNHKGAGAALKKSLNSPKRELQEGAKKLQEIVKTAVSEEYEAAKKAGENNEHWKAFEICQRMSERFSNTDLPSEFAEFKKTLQKESQVKSGGAARRTLDGILKNLAAGRSLTKKSKTQIEKIIADYPESDLARDAQQALDRGIEGN